MDSQDPLSISSGVSGSSCEKGGILRTYMYAQSYSLSMCLHIHCNSSYDGTCIQIMLSCYQYIPVLLYCLSFECIQWCVHMLGIVVVPVLVLAILVRL